MDNYVEWVPCDLCGANNYKVIYPSTYTEKDFSKERVRGFMYASEDRARGNIVRCTNCNLVYMCPRDKNVTAIYEVMGDDEYYLASSEDRLITFEDDLLKLESLTGPANNRRLLDIGSSYGFFLDVAKKHNWDVYGCELSRRQFEFSMKNHRNICNKELYKCGFPENYFDVVTLHDVLEHLPSPSKLLKDIHHLTKYGGILSITTPNFASWPAKISGRFWINLIRMHLFYFTPETIVKILRQNGFEIIKIAKHKRIIKLGIAIRWLKKHPWVYFPLHILFGNRLFKDITIQTGLSGNITVYARKV